MKMIDLVKASAGSGKTYSLMNRLSESIADGVLPQNLLATTFTVKAAAELQSRIRQKLLEGANPELASQVFDGLIGTVNGVCGKLLSEYAIEAGLSPALDVLPEENADLIFNAAISNVIDQYAEKLEQVAARLSLDPIREKQSGPTRDWKKDVREILNLARSNGLSREKLKACGKRAIESLQEVFPASVAFSLDDVRRLVGVIKNYPAQGGETQKTVKRAREFSIFPTWAGAVKLANSTYAKTKDPDFPIEILEEINAQLLNSNELYEDLRTMILGVFDCAGDSLEAYAQYKRDFGLVDFVDQECNVLNLLENNSDFVRLMKERLAQIMVDEFQDTSPVQLALFLKLNECSANNSVWVGDPKQAIYGFRGTDPELMEAVAAEIRNYRTLEYSWRSRKTLVRLANEIFTRAFSKMAEKDVALGIHPDREAEAAGGVIKAWHVLGKNKDERMNALAGNVAKMIRDEGVKPSDVCILFWSNSDCSDFADALAQWNISASAPSGKLLDTPECQLIMAAFRYAIDPRDTVALATLTALSGECPDWLKTLHRARADWEKKGENERQSDFLDGIRDLDFLRNLQKKTDATPMEILEYVILALKLDQKVLAMTSPERRMSNVDELRRLCAEYMQQALVERSAATPAGFVAALNKSAAPQASGGGIHTVNVMTYHKSKGLEWPIVILGSLDSTGKNGAFGIRTCQAESFDAAEPLKGRSIHYWPWPFGDSRKYETLNEILADHPIEKQVKAQEKEECKRLLYVGLTRAKDQVIFALNRKSPTAAEKRKDPDAPDVLQTDWLDALSDDARLLTFPFEEGCGHLFVGDAMFPIETTIASPAEEIIPLPSPPLFVDEEPDVSGICHYPAHRSPSGESCTDGTATLLCRWDYRSAIKCEEGKYNLLGNAFHNFIALNPAEKRREIAERILKNWTVETAVSPETLLACADHLYQWIAERYPGANIRCELPMTYRDENGSLYQGFIDMLLELPDGCVIIDHKTHPAASDAQKYAAKCAGQLRLYRKAVEAATGKPVKATIIHFPNSGRCFEVK